MAIAAVAESPVTSQVLIPLFCNFAIDAAASDLRLSPTSNTP
jgi:hypothetical protein